MEQVIQKVGYLIGGRMEDNFISILKEIQKLNIIDTGSMLTMIMPNLRNEVRKIHTERYAITPPPRPGERWQTYYKKEGGKRETIRARTEEKLLDKLIPLYFSQVYLEKLTFYELFLEWLDYKTPLVENRNTVTRYKQRYRKYLETSCLHDMKLSQIDEILLEKEANRIIKDNRLTRKEWVNVKTILNGMYGYAVKKRYLSENPLDRVEISVKYRQVVRKTGKTETFNTEELADLNRYLETMYTESGDVAFLAIKLNFMLGLRVGELVALQWNDWCDETTIQIVREEVKEQEANAVRVEEHTKTYQDRFVALVPEAIEILNRIERQGKYIFMRDGERITSRQIAYILEKYAERKGVGTKSTHKMRKTYASLLNANGVPLDCIREQLGHNSLNTTLGYIYNPLTQEETYQLICNALQSKKKQ